MLIPFVKEDNFFNERPFIDQEVRFNLFHRILEGEVVGLKSNDNKLVAIGNPGHPMWLWVEESLEKEEINELLKELSNKTKDDQVRGIAGSPEVVKAFAEIYASELNVGYTLSMGMESYYCPEVKKPNDVKGKIIPAELCHHDVVTEFCVGFVLDGFGITVTKESQMDSAKRMIESRNLYLWIVEDEVVTMANVAHRSPRHARINNVYTPPKARKKGYASGLMASLTNLLIKEGLTPVLYADIVNPDSNKVYKNIGYIEQGRIDQMSFKY